MPAHKLHTGLCTSIFILVAWSGVVAGTTDNTGSSISLVSNGSPETSLPAPSHIQVLAGSCAACHGTNGNSVSGTPVLAGLDHDYFVLQMQAFRSGERSATVMQRHAKGLTTEEIEQLATYFSQQKRIPGILPPAQVLDAQYGD